MSALNDPAVLAIRIEGLQSRIERLEKEERKPRP